MEQLRGEENARMEQEQAVEARQEHVRAEEALREQRNQREQARLERLRAEEELRRLQRMQAEQERMDQFRAEEGARREQTRADEARAEHLRMRAEQALGEQIDYIPIDRNMPVILLDRDPDRVTVRMTRHDFDGYIRYTRVETQRWRQWIYFNIYLDRLYAGRHETHLLETALGGRVRVYVDDNNNNNNN